MLGEEYTMHDARVASYEAQVARCRGLIPEYGGTITVLRPDPDPERSWVREGVGCSKDGSRSTMYVWRWGAS